MAGTNKFGEILDLTKESIQKGSRGAQKEFFPELLELMKTITTTTAVSVTFYVVDRAAYPATEAGETAYKNERQRIGAVLRSHAEEAGIGKISLNWHPQGNYPQASLKS